MANSVVIVVLLKITYKSCNQNSKKNGNSMKNWNCFLLIGKGLENSGRRGRLFCANCVEFSPLPFTTL